MSDDQFQNSSDTGEIPSYNGDAKAKATDFANYFCSYAQLYHQKQMLADHQRMASYHAAILGNADSVFRDKVVMDVGAGSGILSVWAAHAGARKVYAVEYTDMAKHAQRVVEANGLEDVVTVIQGAVEDIELPEDTSGTTQVVDVIISEWMGYFLLRESMLDSLIRARDKFLKPRVGLMFPSHTNMYLAPIADEEERKASAQEYSNAMADWFEFAETTKAVYGVDMSILEHDFEREQKEYYVYSSKWAELPSNAVLAEPVMIKHLDMATCTLEDARGIPEGAPDASFSFEIQGTGGPISGFAGWFTADFKSRTDTDEAPTVSYPAFLSTGPENGYTHWGQQVFYLPSPIPVLRGEVTHLQGSLQMTRTKANARLYNCKIIHKTSRCKVKPDGTQVVLCQSDESTHVYQIP